MAIYKIFSVPFGKSDKVIGTADAINLWPKLSADGIPAWVQRPGLRQQVMPNFPPSEGGGDGGLECTAESVIPFDHDYVVANEQKIYSSNLQVWEFDNVAGTLFCPNIHEYGGGDRGVSAICINDYFVSPLPSIEEKRTVSFIYHTVSDPFFTLYLGFPRILNSAASKRAYFNISENEPAFNFTSVADGPIGDGAIYIECVKVDERDWLSLGENNLDIYYP